jgi:MoaA/NifB/PqqE/SkfB family radical SAM enzyme
VPETISIRAVYLHVTRACNLRCGHCYFDAGGPMPVEMSAADYATLWPQLAQLSPEKVILTGGEPLMRADLLSLLATLRKADPVRRMTVCLNTNGSLVTPSLARRLREFVDEVRVSVDGTEPVHDAFRGEGSLRAALDALSRFAVAGFVPRAVITATRTSLSCLDQTLLLLLRHGVTNIRLARFHPIGRGLAADAPAMDETGEAFRAAWSKVYPASKTTEKPRAPQAPRHCGAGRYLSILPDGEVYPCHMLAGPEFRCGHVRCQRLEQICRRDGLLAGLQAADFDWLARQASGLGAHLGPGTCLGEAVVANPLMAARLRASMP